MGLQGWWRSRRRGWIFSATVGAGIRGAISRSASAVRHHYMLGVTAVVLGLAAAGGLGYFDEPAPSRGSIASAPEAETAPSIPFAGRTPVPTRPFEITIFLVNTREEQSALYAAENTYRSPYLLGGRSAEVLLVRTVEDELMAAHRFEEVRATFPGANVVVTDLR